MQNLGIKNQQKDLDQKEDLKNIVDDEIQLKFSESSDPPKKTSPNYIQNGKHTSVKRNPFSMSTILKIVFYIFVAGVIVFCFFFHLFQIQALKERVAELEEAFTISGGSLRINYPTTFKTSKGDAKTIINENGIKLIDGNEKERLEINKQGILLNDDFLNFGEILIQDSTGNKRISKMESN